VIRDVHTIVRCVACGGPIRRRWDGPCTVSVEIAGEQQRCGMPIGAEPFGEWGDRPAHDYDPGYEHVSYETCSCGHPRHDASCEVCPTTRRGQMMQNAVHPFRPGTMMLDHEAVGGTQ
jgi:hypothetical protein